MSFNQSEKMEIIKLVEGSNLTIKQTLKELGVPRSTFYEWYRRYIEDGYDGLSAKKRIINKIWNKIPDSERENIIKIALENPAKSCREIAFLVTDKYGYFISESSVYRILKGQGLVTSPVYNVITAKDKFEDPTKRVNELWQTDFTYFKILEWGWYYLSTVLDDYSRYIIAWKLCKGMSSEDVMETIDMAIAKTEVTNVPIRLRPGILSDNGPSYIANEFKKYINQQGLWHTRGRPFHPQTQGKIERYHRSMKNVILLDNYYCPGELENRIKEWVDYYNNERYHEAIDNITPADKFHGRAEEILERRQKIKVRTMIQRRLINQSY